MYLYLQCSMSYEVRQIHGGTWLTPQLASANTSWSQPPVPASNQLESNLPQNQSQNLRPAVVIGQTWKDVDLASSV